MTETSSPPLAIIILAAGKGSRMKSALPKVMHPLAGKPMIGWLIETCEALDPAKIIVVAGPDMPALEAAVAPHECVIQTTQNGTADAVKPALPLLEGFEGQVLILMGDEPLIPLETLRAMAAHDGLAALVFDTPAPKGLGRVIQHDDGTLKAIIEDKDCTAEQRLITLCNAGTYSVPAAQLGGWISRIGNDNAQEEYYLTDLPLMAARDGVACDVISLSWSGSWGINTRAQLAAHEAMLQNRLRHAHMEAGVSMLDPDTVYLWHDTQIASDCVIEPSVFFGANVVIESGVHIKAFSHIEGAHIGKNSVVGPFARLRPDTVLGQDVKIGNFVEIKKSDIGNRSKVSHLGYIGDASLDEDVNFGCGAITVNYDGFEKHRTSVGKNVMIGSNANLIAPVRIDDGAFIAAGSTITEDITADCLAISRAPAKISKGWAAKFREIKAAAKDNKK